jgi:hypothetical protein
MRHACSSDSRAAATSRAASLGLEPSGPRERSDVLGDYVVATVILERILQNSDVLTIRGEKYRLLEKHWAELAHPAARSPRPHHSERSPDAPLRDSSDVA